MVIDSYENDQHDANWNRRSLGFFAGVVPLLSGNWVKLDSGTTSDLTAVHFADAQQGWVAGAFGTVLKTSNGGARWEQVKIPSRASLVSVFARTGNDVFVARNELSRSIDGGATWREGVDRLAATTSIFDIEFVSPESGVFVKAGQIYRSTDGGENWVQASRLDGLFLDALHVADAKSLYATGGITYIDLFGSRMQGQLARSQDGGDTWEAVPLEGIQEIHSAVWYSGGVGMIFTFAGTSHLTRDGGDTWDLVSDSMADTEGEPVGIITDAVITDDDMIVGGTFGGALVESQEGDVWKREVDVGAPLSAVTKAADGSVYAVGNNGNIWKRLPANVSSLPLAVTSISLDRDGVIIAVKGTTGSEYRLESSQDLVKWSNVTAVVALADIFTFEVKTPGQGEEFYFRVVEVRRE